MLTVFGDSEGRASQHRVGFERAKGRQHDRTRLAGSSHDIGEKVDDANIDVGVIDFLANVMAATGQTSAVVLSAFRSLETNAMLARTTFGVAENSQHLYGRALDVRFANNLPDAVAVARAMRRGGVGWYPRSGFIHLDTGPVRNWDLDNEGLQDLLITPRAIPLGPGSKGEMLVNGPGTLIIGGRKPPVVLPGRVLSSRQRVGLSHLLAKAQSAPR